MEPLPGCENFQLLPTEWHVVHEPLRCPDGRGWHEVQSDFDPGCENAQDLPGLRWHEEQLPDLCFAGRGWHEEQSPELGCA